MHTGKINANPQDGAACKCCGATGVDLGNLQVCIDCWLLYRRNPCNNCGDRYLRCHSACERYAKWVHCFRTINELLSSAKKEARHL